MLASGLAYTGQSQRRASGVLVGTTVTLIPASHRGGVAICDLKAYNCGMEIEFDPTKSASNEVARGFDFAFAARVFIDRGDVRRIISAHRASRQEKRRWPPSE